MDLPTFLWFLETLKVTLFVTACVAAAGGTVLYALGKRAERRQRKRRDVWGS
jgi:hypothetical protein